MSNQTSFRSVVRPITKVINTVLPGTALDFSGRATNLDFTANQSSQFDSLVNHEHLIDGQTVIVTNKGTEIIYVSPALMANNTIYTIEGGMTAVFIFIAASQKFFDAGGSATSKDIADNLNTTNNDLLFLNGLFLNHDHSGMDNPKIKVSNLDAEGVSTPYHVLALNGSGIPVFQDVKTYTQATARYSNTDTTTNIGLSSSWAEVPLMGTMERRDNTSIFIPVGNGIQVNWAGRVKVRAHVIGTSTTQNSQLDISFKKNTAVQSRISSAYIRVSSGAEEGTCVLFDELDVLPGDVISVVSRQSGATGAITLLSNGSSYIEVEIPPAVYAKGDQGPAGYAGWAYIAQAGAPSSLLGNDGDIYLNTDNSDLYQRAAGVWTFRTNIKGQIGDPGVSKMLLWAERVGTLTNNSEEWSFGGASSSGAGRGIVQMSGGKITHLSLECTVPGSTGVVTVEVMKNGISTGQSITLAETIAKGYVALVTPISYVVGDIIGFRTVLGGSAANARMAVLIVEDGVTITPPAFVAPTPWKHSHGLNAGDISAGYIDLPHTAITNTINASMNRLNLHENEDYTTSVVNNLTRITLTNAIAVGGDEAAVIGDVLYFQYYY